MKTEILFGLILLISLNVFGKPTTVISGEILNFTGDKVSLLVSTGFISNDLEQEATVDKNGNFKFEIDVEGAKPIILKTGKNNIELLLTEGDSITCSFDYNNVIESMQFRGNRASHYNYFLDYYRKFNLPHAMFTKPDFSDIFNMAPNEFKSYRSSKVQSDLNFLEEFVSKHQVTNEFKLYCETEIKYSYYYALAAYESLRGYFKNVTDTLPEGFYDELSGDLFYNDKYLISRNYGNAMTTYVSKIKSGTYDEPVSFHNRAFVVIDNELKNKSHDFCMAKMITDLFMSDAPGDFKDSVATDFINKSNYPDYTASVTKLYTKSLDGREKKLPADVLSSEIEKVDGQTMTIEKLLKTCKNKVVYIDVWASFCGPCKIEMPYSEKLKHALSDKDVVFIYISIDKNTEAWKGAMNDCGGKGQNYLLKGGLNTAFAKHFNIYGVPHYILIDKQGNVIFPSAARPSSASIKNSILTLCKQ